MTIVHSTMEISPPSLSDAPQACRICRLQVSGPDRQNHMGRHILHKLRGVNHEDEATQVTESVRRDLLLS